MTAPVPAYARPADRTAPPSPPRRHAPDCACGVNLNGEPFTDPLCAPFLTTGKEPRRT